MCADCNKDLLWEEQFRGQILRLCIRTPWLNFGYGIDNLARKISCFALFLEMLFRGNEHYDEYQLLHLRQKKYLQQKIFHSSLMGHSDHYKFAYLGLSQRNGSQKNGPQILLLITQFCFLSPHQDQCTENQIPILFQS